MIAATARVHPLIIATRNEVDFRQLDVRILNPFKTSYVLSRRTLAWHHSRFLERRSVEECENLNHGRMRRFLRLFSKLSNFEQSERLGNSMVQAALTWQSPEKADSPLGGGHGLVSSD